jgi:hypothetical protein
VPAPPIESPSAPNDATAAGPSTPQAEACAGWQLEPSIDSERTGPTAGTEQVVILFQNVSDSACWLSGIPVVGGVSVATGIVTSLKLFESTDNSYEPGVILPGSYGVVRLWVGLNNCPGPPVVYSELNIAVSEGQYVRMPVPGQLASLEMGCVGDIGHAGPWTPTPEFSG